MSKLGSALVKELLKNCSYMQASRLIRTSSTSNEILSTYEVTIADAVSNQRVLFTVWVSEFDDKVQGYTIVDFLGNKLSDLRDDTLAAYFEKPDYRMYMADLGRVAMRFGGRSKWVE